ncbi:MAG: TonB-dependent receptor, partial [Desulfobacteraceae bacterium]
QGRVTIKRPGDSGWRPVRLDDTRFAGDQIRVDANSRAGIVLRNDAVLRLDQNTILTFTEIEEETTFIFRLLKGAANFFSRRPRSLKILTPFVNGVVEGTEFLVRVYEDRTHIDLFEGRLQAYNPHGEVQLTPGQGATALAGSAPQRRLLVKPRESVQWALYYPPVLALSAEKMPEGYQSVLESAHQGRWINALNELEQIEANLRDSEFHAFRAALYLHQGSIAEARNDLHRALTLEPANSEALALQAVIAVVQNQREEAQRIAQDAVQSNTKSTAAQLALSYARQAYFDLPGALQAAEVAVALAPENGTPRARLAELRLSAGQLDQGLKTAQKAVALNPNDSHAYSLLGFGYLTQIKTLKARMAFEKAIALDSAAPLPRLGLGLAKIRDGALENGRSEIEIAVGLDPLNALMRSYLGKAYFDEKRGPLDATQLEIAKTLDPNDPTPWFYDAIRKHSLNRPVKALQDLQQSIRLNDNRAVYRSRFFLDEDFAARSASLGKIYNNLDFQLLAQLEGYKSLNVDSTNHSAHRLLADTYAAKPRHEIARVSELLQAQLFQSINLTPIQARLGETDTSFLEGSGPAELSFNEFNPLFTRNSVALQASALAAGQKTWGSELTGSGVFDKISTSVSQFHYKTDGFRENNDYVRDLTDIFIHGSLTPHTHLQAEIRHSEVDRGDRSQNFDGGFSEDIREKESVDKIRIGGRHVFSPRFETIFSYIHTDLKIGQQDTISGMPGSSRVTNNKQEGYLAEMRSDYKSPNFSLAVGAGRLDEDLKRTTTGRLGPPLFFSLTPTYEFADINRSNGYAYSYLRPSKQVELIIGFSTDVLDRGEQIETTQFNPKAGLLWYPADSVTVRLAAFRVLANGNLAAQTIEPTQVAGFNQFFDDLNGSEIWSFNAGISKTFTSRLFGGMEASKRQIDVPQFSSSPTPAIYFPWDEVTGAAYLYWTPFDSLAVSCEYLYERFDREKNPLTRRISEATTHKIPLGVRFFHSEGLSSGVKATYYFQDGTFQNTGATTFSEGNDNFWIIDAEMSYRLTNRLGVLAVGVKNLSDAEFNYQDTDPANPTISEERSIYARITLSF